MSFELPMNVIFIISDTLRKDHLGCYGNSEIRTPNLDRLAEKSVVFDRCYAASFATMPARADLMTGKYCFPSLAWGPLPRSETTLAEYLRPTDYRSMGVADTPFFMRNGYGYDRGFDDFKWIQGQSFFTLETEEYLYERRYEEDYFPPLTMKTAARWLERHYKEKFLLYVDTWDPHEPWDPPNWYVEPYHPGYNGEQVHPCYWFWKEKGYTEEDLKLAHACYCGEVTMVDRWVGHLLDTIELLGLMENTAIIFTADHGYYFGEHGIFGKSLMKNWSYGYTGDAFLRSSVYDEVARVPLLVYLPGEEPRQIDGLVNLPDLMATMLELCGVEPSPEIHGRSILPIIRSESPGREIVLTSRPYHLPGETVFEIIDRATKLTEPVATSVNTHEWTLICSHEGEEVELYYTPEDPGQTRNIYAENREMAEELHRKYYQFMVDVGTPQKHLELRSRL